jgi:small GTP-binding protein
MRHHLPVVAIVGRPNAGQSTLFNRLIRQRKAVVEPTPGVARDRNVAQARWRDHPFLLVDTGGLDPSATTGLAGLVQAQTRLAIEEADHVLFLFDGKAGINPADTDAVDLLRRSGKPVFFAVNKMDARPQELLLTETSTRSALQPSFRSPRLTAGASPISWMRSWPRSHSLTTAMKQQQMSPPPPPKKPRHSASLSLAGPMSASHPY